MSRTVKEIIADLAPAYKEWKGGEKSKNTLRDEFFEAITELLEGEGAEDLIIVTAISEEHAIEEAERQRPGWIVDAIRPLDDIQDEWEVIVVENPLFMPFTIEYDGHVWGRQVSEGDSLLDNEKLEAEDPELWKRVTELPHRKLVEDVAYESGKDPRDCEFEQDGYSGWEGFIEWQLERHGYNRSLKDFEDITNEDAAILQNFMYVGKPKVKLPAPKKVKE